MTSKLPILVATLLANTSVTEAVLCKTVEITKEEIDTLLAELQTYLEPLGLKVIVTKKVYKMISEVELPERQVQLSESQREVLTLIAYGGGVTKAAIDRWRGVNSQQALQALTEYELLSSLTTVDNEIMYEISVNGLALLGVSEVEELPAYSERHLFFQSH